jgi:hypothetical protein
MSRRTKRRRSYRPSRGIFAGRTFRSEADYRKALAARRAAPKGRRATSTVSRGSAESRLLRHHALAVVNRMRVHGESLEAASAEEGISPQSVRREARSALRRDRRGRWRATKRDRLLRQIAFYTPRGPIWLDVRNSDDARRIAQHAAAMKAFGQGDVNALRPFRGAKVRVGGVEYPFLTDPVAATMILKAQVVEFELYRS